MPHVSITKDTLPLSTTAASKRMATIEETLVKAISLCTPVQESEVVSLSALPGRTAASKIISLFQMPLRDHSAVDGYAVAGIENTKFHVTSRIIAGDAANLPLQPGEAARIMTGAPIPSGTDAVILQENITRTGDEIETSARARMGDNIRRAGEDIQAQQTLIEPGTRLDARHMALLVASGYAAAPVIRKLRVAVLSTGNELRNPGVAMGPASIFDTNRPMLTALLSTPTIEITDLGILPDNLTTITEALKQAAETHDMIISSGGVSVGEEDHLKPAVEAAGGHIDSWKMAIKPGKPVALGRIGKAVFLGLPGNPVACLVDFLLLGRPMLDRMSGAAENTANTLPKPFPAVANFDWQRHAGRQEYVPVVVAGIADDGLPLVERAGKSGSARLLPLVGADGFAIVTADRAEVAKGSRISYLPFRPGARLGD